MAPPERPDEVILLVDPGCPPCEAAKVALADVPNVRVLDISAPEADEYLGDLEAVPVPYAVARWGEEQRTCDLAYEGTSVLLICDEEVIPLKE